MNQVLGTLEALRELNGQFIKLVQDEAKVKFHTWIFLLALKIYNGVLGTMTVPYSARF